MPASMFGAPHTTRSLAVAEVDVGEPDAVGVGMRDDVEDARRRRTPWISRPGSLDRLDLEAELVQRVATMLVDRRVDRREVTDPGQRCAHRSEPSELGEEADVVVAERS